MYDIGFQRYSRDYKIRVCGKDSTPFSLELSLKPEITCLIIVLCSGTGKSTIYSNI